MMELLEQFLEWLYSDVMLDASVFDDIFEAAKRADPTRAIDVYAEWYRVNFGDDSDN